MTDDRDRKPDELDEAVDDASVIEPESTSPIADDQSPADAVGAYLLDALDETERTEFEAFLDSSPETQAELRRLAPVVTLLPKLFELEAGDESPAPTPELRERIIEAATTEAVERASSEARARTIRTAPTAPTPLETRRRAARPADRPAQRPTPAPLASLSRFPSSWLIAAGVTVVAIGAIIWALALQGRIDSKNREIAAQSERITSQESEIAGLRENANATSFALSSSSEQTAGATGTVLYSLQDQIGVLYVRNMNELEDALVYQLWYLDDESDAPLPGGTFTVDDDGSGFVVVDADTPVFDALAITVEPEGGSDAPTSAVVMQGRLGGARG